MLIFEELGIVLRSSGHYFLVRTIIGLSISLFACMTFTALLCFWIDSWVWILGLSVLFAIVVGYVTVTSCLSTLLKTNRFLDILLKDTLHELNIPLSVINANLQMLQADEHDEKKLKRLGRIDLASKDLYALYTEVDYYIKKEILEDVREKFYLDELILSVIEKQKEVAEGINIMCTVLHVEIFADKHGFAKVISNLLHNALKYNKDHNEIHIFQEKENLVIKDQGLGMSEAELFLAFDRYYQADTTKEGYGIGLSLVKAYCDEFKITMRINSQKNIGTEVVLDISHLLNKK
ncbi:MULTISPECIES: HAMP domain-containing sensor histidine kinase [unclassified Sulfurospirillum]|uniref:sensor histidine kinase n=1 Tax=unclassified Sulfurospirillum TaxID=2618290 RepID=UPI0005037F6A|nr:MULTISPECIES: HAMP domain-containing sensor histidine kinase [unclassified Sulfurospirillum]KFL33412.1 ATP-binding protein [Sulfurospirillum sp. SCADC]